MAVTHAATVRNTIATAINTAINAGAAAGKLVFQTAASAEVATLTLSDPAGTVSGAVLTFSAITSDTSATGGTTDRFKITDSDDNSVVLGSVGTSGQDINLSSVVIGANDTVSVSSLTYTAPV